MRNRPGMKDYTGAGGHERICMELLVAECRHVALVARNELIEVVDVPAKARSSTIQRKERYTSIKRLKRADFTLTEGEVTCFTKEIPG